MNNQKPKIRKYTVDKKVIFQEKYCEVQYKAKDNFIIGKWKRSGTSIRETPSNREILCNSCRENFWKTLKETEDTAKRLSEESNKSFSSISNYQVRGWTLPSNRYEWELNSCQNNESCWGEKEQVFTFHRRKKSSSETLYRFMQFKIHPFENRDKSITLVEKDVNSVYFNVRNVDRLRQEGIGLITVTPTKPFFWPGIHKHLETGDYYYFIEIHHNAPVPDYKDGPWPTEFWRRNFLFPTMVDIVLYKATPGLPKPDTHHEMAMNHERASLTCLNLYPGMVCLFFTFGDSLLMKEEQA